MGENNGDGREQAGFELEDEGWATATIKGPPDPETGQREVATLRLDLLAVKAKISDYHKKNEAKPTDEYNAGLVDLIESLGFPRCSQDLATRFVGHIFDRYVALKKKFADSDALPAGSDSPPSP